MLYAYDMMSHLLLPFYSHLMFSSRPPLPAENVCIAEGVKGEYLPGLQYKDLVDSSLQARRNRFNPIIKSVRAHVYGSIALCVSVDATKRSTSSEQSGHVRLDMSGAIFVRGRFGRRRLEL